jgi:hypothetical protein
MGQVIAAIALLAPAIVEVVKLFKATPTPDKPVPQTETLTRDERIELIERARRELKMNPNVFNFGITGQTRTGLFSIHLGCLIICVLGKSSLINGIRLIPDNHPSAAVVGETETTMTVKPFPHPEFPHFVVWDIPGAGTASHPIATYFHDKCLMAFDALIVNCE